MKLCKLDDKVKCNLCEIYILCNDVSDVVPDVDPPPLVLLVLQPLLVLLKSGAGLALRPENKSK